MASRRRRTRGLHACDYTHSVAGPASSWGCLQRTETCGRAFRRGRRPAPNVGDRLISRRGCPVGRRSPDPARGATAGLLVYLGCETISEMETFGRAFRRGRRPAPNVGDRLISRRGCPVGRGSPDPARGATAGLRPFRAWSERRPISEMETFGRVFRRGRRPAPNVGDPLISLRNP